MRFVSEINWNLFLIKSEDLFRIAAKYVKTLNLSLKFDTDGQYSCWLLRAIAK